MKRYESIPASEVEAFKVEFPEGVSEETKVEGYPVEFTKDGVPYITVNTESGKKRVGQGTWIVEGDSRVLMSEKEFTSKYREIETA